MNQAFAELSAVALASTALEESIAATGRRMAAGLRAGGKILTCGNGGSAADALHLAEELTGRYHRDRPALAAVCLAADPTALTCIANDYGFEAVFARQVEALGRPGDVLVAFTTSGSSPNLRRALEAARARGVYTILVAGRDGGPARPLADCALIVPSHHGPRIQEIHTCILHQWLEIIESDLFGPTPSA